MALLKKYMGFGVLLFLLVLVFLLTYHNATDPDLYFDLGSGAIFLKLGIIHVDVFSFVTHGREWFPYEWLFQVGLFLYQKFFGFGAIGLLVGLLAAVHMGIASLGIKKVFRLNMWQVLICSLIYFSFVFQFFVPRPFIIANLFLVISSFLILLYVFKKKNYLFLLLPIILLWVNIHGSFVILLFLLFLYTIIFAFRYLLLKKHEFKEQTITLAIYSAICFGISLLPPVGIDQYRLLLLFFQYHSSISRIIEWKPLLQGTTIFTSMYIPLILVTAIPIILLVVKKRAISSLVFLFPFIILIFTPFLAQRNLVYGFISFFVLSGWIVSVLKKSLWLYVFLLINVVLAEIALYSVTIIHPDTYHNPTKAADFILSEDIQGNMFNSFDYGGYLLYRLYPKQKVFTDGRADLYLCCELPLMDDLNNKIRKKKTFDGLFESTLQKYMISFVLITRDFPVEMKQLLSTDPNWSLVFWDDTAQIFVKRDGKNSWLVSHFGTTYATPYGPQPFDEKQMDKALQEYQRMVNISDSGKSRNEIGIILLKKGQIENAKENFVKGIQTDPDFFPLHANLASIYVAQQDYEDAKKEYKEMIRITPTDPTAYLILAQVYLKIDDDTASARDILQQGLDNVQDEKAKLQIESLLNTATQ